MQSKQLFPLFDAAYLGLTSGDFDRDAWAIRHFASHGMELAVCLSFAKMMGLYSERVGALNLVTNSAKEARVVESHVEQLMRAEISNPPAFGARVAAEVLSDPELRASWKSDLKSMTFRLQDMRLRLVEELKRLGEYRILNFYQCRANIVRRLPQEFRPCRGRGRIVHDPWSDS